MHAKIKNVLRQNILLSLLILTLATLGVWHPIAPIAIAVAIVAGVTCWRYPLVGLITAIIATAAGEFARISVGGLDLLALDIIAPAVFAVWLIQSIIRKSAIPLDGGGGWLIAFWVIALISLVKSAASLPASEAMTATMHFIRFVGVSGLYFVARAMNGQRIIIERALIASVILLAFSGFVILKFIPDFGEAGLADVGWDPHIGRLTGTWLDPNFAGGAFAFFIALIGSRLLSTRKVFEQSWLIGTAGLLVIALLLTYSRSGLLALGVAGLVIGLIRSRVLLALGIALFIVGVAVSPRLGERVGEFTQTITSLGSESQQVMDPTAKLRVDSWQEGLRLWGEYPTLGVGYGAYGSYQTFVPRASHAASGADSSLLTVAATTGTVGLLVYLALLSNFFWSAWQRRHDALAFGFFAGGLGLVAHSFFVNSLFFPPLALVLFVTAGVIAGLPRIAR